MSKRTVSLATIARRVTACTRCPELRSYCAEVGVTKRRAYEGWTYWAKPVPAFGDHEASLMIVGLAPAAHGANRTGRMFTGDRSGDFLYAALHRAGLASQAEATDRRDGLELSGVYITAALRCAPPGNRPSAAQLGRCRDHLVAEIDRLRPPVMLCLGGIGWNAAVAALGLLGQPVPRPRPRFGHGAETAIGFTTLLGSYHVSQQNTFTGRLTPAMLDQVLGRARRLVGPGIKQTP